MIDYGEKPENQMQLDLPGVTDDGKALMDEARRWAALHFEEFCWYKGHARAACVNGGKASPNYELQSMRHRFKVSIPNAYAPCLARIAMEQDKGIKFRLARSKVDGFTEVRL